MNLDKLELAALSRMFSASVMRELGAGGQSALLARLLPQSGVAGAVAEDATVGDAFDVAFALLRSLGNRDEYVYRSALTLKILLGHHNLRTASMLSEARVGVCKADVVVLNGTATAYEIKSERDSLARLQSQLAAYSELFAAVNVVTSPSHLESVMRLVPADVGVLLLSDRFTLRTERPAVVDPSRTNPLAVLDFVRIEEAASILGSFGLVMPAVPNTMVRGALREVFATLDPSRLHQQMVTTLKASRSQRDASDFIQTVPMSLRAAMLSMKMSPSSQRRLRDATRLPVDVALAWR